DTGASQYWLWVGTSEGGKDIYSGGQGTNTSRKISGLPHNGETLYVRLNSMVNGEWVASNCTYTSPVYTAAVIQSPVPGSVLSSTAVTFTWNETGAEQYWLWVGTSEGGKDIYSDGQGTNTSRTVFQLPNKGETLYVRLFSKLNGEWPTNSYTYTACDHRPVITVTGPDERTSYEDSTVIAGTAVGVAADLASVTAISDREQEPFPVETDNTGAFSCKIPLAVGPNLLTFIAKDIAGNEGLKHISVAYHLPGAVKTEITSPADGAVVYEEPITVSGTVTSSLDPDQITLMLGDRTGVLSGENGEYTFSFKNVGLAEGSNLLEVVAETEYGKSSASATVHYYSDPDQEAPTIEIHSPLPGTCVATGNVDVKGTARSLQGIESVTVNSSEVPTTPESGTEVFFELKDVEISEGQISVTATDTAGNSSSVTLDVESDSTPPNITLITPSEHTENVFSVTETPYLVTGDVNEKNLAGFSVNSRNIHVLPSATLDTWSFEAGIVLTAREDLPLTLEAWDCAGNRKALEFILKLSASAIIEMISPSEGSEYTASGSQTEIKVTARVSGSPAGSTAEVSADGGTPQIIPMTAGLVNGIFLSPATHDDQILTLRISDTQGATVAQTSVRYKITDPESIPLRVEKTDPANNAENAEPNDVIQFYFNRPVEESELQATVKETAHGLVYDTEKYKNAGIAEMSDISFIEVHRDMETVPGKLSVLTGGYIAHFYPSRDFAYGGRVSAKLTFNGEELFRSVFTVRDLPTFVAGAVSDLYGSAVVGVEVHLPDPGKVAVTDTEGGFSFGFGESSESMLSPGRYQLVINPNLKNRAFGTLEMRINVEQGRLNNTGIIRIPMLDPDEPFRRIRGGTEKALLADGSLEMDFSEAVLAFPDGRSEGDVHVQPQSIDAVPFGTLPGAVPHWMFAVQPQGIEISGSVGIVLKMPRLHGTYDYIPPDMTPVLIVGFDTESEKIVPVGAGRISNGRVLSDVTEAVNDKNKKVNLLSMNYIGYALVQPEQHALLEQYLEGTISLRVLTGKLVQ
ncbi:MAG: hypothetical protein GY800_07555, partial [Planctomycetes bacterium]|nr:hypothetical protein [Planctomycetota bacterium]